MILEMHSVSEAGFPRHTQFLQQYTLELDVFYPLQTWPRCSVGTWLCHEIGAWLECSTDLTQLWTNTRVTKST